MQATATTVSTRVSIGRILALGAGALMAFVLGAALALAATGWFGDGARSAPGFRSCASHCGRHVLREYGAAAAPALVVGRRAPRARHAREPGQVARRRGAGASGPRRPLAQRIGPPPRMGTPFPRRHGPMRACAVVSGARLGPSVSGGTRKELDHARSKRLLAVIEALYDRARAPGLPDRVAAGRHHVRLDPRARRRV